MLLAPKQEAGGLSGHMAIDRRKEFVSQRKPYV